MLVDQVSTMAVRFKQLLHSTYAQFWQSSNISKSVFRHAEKSYEGLINILITFGITYPHHEADIFN